MQENNLPLTLVVDVLLAAAVNNTSIEHECTSLEGAPSANTIRGVLRSSLELQQLERQVNQALWVPVIHMLTL